MDLSCGLKKVPLLGHEPCGGLRSSMDQVIGSVRFRQDLTDSLSYPVLLRFYYVLNSCNTPLPNLDRLESALLYSATAYPLTAESETDLGCHVSRVQACRHCVDLDRTGYHAVDAGFWVVLELIIRWIRIRFDLIDLSLPIRLVPSPWTPIRLNSRIRQCSHE